MSTRVTRRELAVALAVPAALLGQAVVPQNPDEELKAARDQVRQNGETLAKFAIPVTSEPAVHFKA